MFPICRRSWSLNYPPINTINLKSSNNSMYVRATVLVDLLPWDNTEIFLDLSFYPHIWIKLCHVKTNCFFLNNKNTKDRICTYICLKCKHPFTIYQDHIILSFYHIWQQRTKRALFTMTGIWLFGKFSVSK